ncbi:MAG: bifunctional 4-hydroxy-2-oxoglutarate aldolase/2-dehydro-3-deoxy-phosphogluconate aldolase [Acidobacteria bacterium]|nr:bifunctional 4-hydroxy-2-oxoglutarate aldolase/2-dehydro-3-deoxy-phosphogluconate aldolase [Acidobacteriota bacterium]
MNKKSVHDRIIEIGVVPVVRASSARDALVAAGAVAEGGIPVVEITMTVPGALDVIRELARSNSSSVLIGAGTVLDCETAKRCVDAGAEFLVSPALNLETIEFAGKQNLLMIAGALTPTEVVQAWRAGSDFVKVFPCGPVGGARYIKALKGPLPQIPLVPTGGVNLTTAAEFLEAGADALGVGGELVATDALKSGRREVIVDAASKFAAIVKATRNRLAPTARAL